MKNILSILVIIISTIGFIFTIGGGADAFKNTLLDWLGSPIIEYEVFNNKEKNTYKFIVSHASGETIEKLEIKISGRGAKIAKININEGSLRVKGQEKVLPINKNWVPAIQVESVVLYSEKLLNGERIIGEITMFDGGVPSLYFDAEAKNPKYTIGKRDLSNPSLFFQAKEYINDNQAGFLSTFSFIILGVCAVIILGFVIPGLEKFLVYMGELFSHDHINDFKEYLKSLPTTHDRGDIALLVLLLIFVFSMNFYEAVFIYFLITRYKVIVGIISRLIKNNGLEERPSSSPLKDEN